MDDAGSADALGFLRPVLAFIRQIFGTPAAGNSAPKRSEDEIRRLDAEVNHMFLAHEAQVRETTKGTRDTERIALELESRAARGTADTAEYLEMRSMTLSAIDRLHRSAEMAEHMRRDGESMISDFSRHGVLVLIPATLQRVLALVVEMEGRIQRTLRALENYSDVMDHRLAMADPEPPRSAEDVFRELGL